MSQPLDEQQWRHPEWIQHFGLRTDNVLSYFSESPFFDRTSNNQVLKMQSQFNENLPPEALNSVNIINELKKLRGVEFVVHHSRDPDFWIVRKQLRHDPDHVEFMADYYIIGANVYMAPKLRDIVANRLLSTSWALKKAMNSMGDLATYSPADGHAYKFQSAQQQQHLEASQSGTGSRTRPGVGGATPYTPTVQATPGSANQVGSSTEGLSRGTVNNLFNMALVGKPVYLDEEPSEDGVYGTGATPFGGDELGRRSRA